MNPSCRLGKLKAAALKRLGRLRSRVSGLSFPIVPNDDISVAWVTVEALNLWGGFLRAYYLSGAISCRTASGKPVKFVVFKFPNMEAALKFAAHSAKGGKVPAKLSRRDEPAWHDAKVFLKLEKSVGASNLAQIYAAFGIATPFTECLSIVRNFYAHRCDETARKAARVGVKLGLSTKPELRPTKILCSKLPKRPQNVLTDWIDDMSNIIDVLCS
jgi:hypothetical protein